MASILIDAPDHSQGLARIVQRYSSSLPSEDFYDRHRGLAWLAQGAASILVHRYLKQAPPNLKAAHDVVASLPMPFIGKPVELMIEVAAKANAVDDTDMLLDCLVASNNFGSEAGAIQIAKNVREDFRNASSSSRDAKGLTLARVEFQLRKYLGSLRLQPWLEGWTAALHSTNLEIFVGAVQAARNLLRNEKFSTDQPESALLIRGRLLSALTDEHLTALAKRPSALVPAALAEAIVVDAGLTSLLLDHSSRTAEVLSRCLFNGRSSLISEAISRVLTSEGLQYLSSYCSYAPNSNDLPLALEFLIPALSEGSYRDQAKERLVGRLETLFRTGDLQRPFQLLVNAKFFNSAADSIITDAFEQAIDRLKWYPGLRFALHRRLRAADGVLSSVDMAV